MPHPRETVALRIERDLPTVVGAAVGAVQDAMPAYRVLRGPQLADVEAIAYWALRRLLVLWVSGSDGVDARDRSRFRAIGVARASDGRPLTDVLRAYRVASSVFIRHVATTHLTDLDPVDFAELSIAALDGVDSISEEIIDAYTAAREQLTSDRGHARAALLDDLLAGRHSSPGALADRCRELGLDLPAQSSLLVVECADPHEVVGSDLLGGLDLDAGEPHRHLATRRGSRTVLLVPASIPSADIERVCSTLHLRACVIAGRPTADAGVSYRLAGDALDTAPDHAFDGRCLLDEGDSQLLALLTARPTADTAAVVAAVLGQLADPAHGHILAGLAAFIATGTATNAAAALRVHPQTLRYRLRRARELSGRDPRRAWHRLALDTAIQLRRLQHPA